MKRRLLSNIMGILDQVQLSVLKEKQTWQAFAIAVVLFSTVSFGALTMFDSMDEVFQSDAEPEPIPNMIFESLNRTGIEDNITNETGWFELDNFRGDIIILDFMAHDCSNCHAVQAHLESEMEEWQRGAQENGSTLRIIGYGAWYSEDIPYLNESSGSYTVPLYPTGLGSTTAAIMSNNTTADPVRLFTTGGTGQIPVVMVIDEEGYIIASQSTGTPTDGWKSFDSIVDKAI